MNSQHFCFYQLIGFFVFKYSYIFPQFFVINPVEFGLERRDLVVETWLTPKLLEVPFHVDLGRTVSAATFVRGPIKLRVREYAAIRHFDNCLLLIKVNVLFRVDHVLEGGLVTTAL